MGEFVNFFKSKFFSSSLLVFLGFCVPVFCLFRLYLQWFFTFQTLVVHLFSPPSRITSGKTMIQTADAGSPQETSVDSGSKLREDF